MKYLARLRERKFSWWFVLVLLLLYGFLGIYEVLPLRPQSVHQWAQADRASVALRYYEDGMNFFLPRVHHMDNGTGTTGIEFPIVNYSAAILYQLFGFHEWLYRLLVLIVVSAGVVAAGALARKILNDSLWAGLVALTWFLSPVFVYYSANFQPDTPSLGFIMVGWFAFFKLKEKVTVKWLVILLLAAALGALIKITSAISIIAMIIILMMDYFSWLNGKDNLYLFHKKIWIFSVLIVALLATASWYSYSVYLNEHYQAGYLLMHARHAESLGDLWQLMRGAFHFWGFVYYPVTVWIAVAIAAALSFVFIKRMNRLLFTTAWLVFFGSLGYYLLMSFQFRDHDYYVITLLPVAYFFLILIADFLKKQKPKIEYLSLAAFAFLFLTSAVYARHVQKVRYAPDPPAFHAYFDIEPYLDSLQITRQDTVFSAYDESFDISLYLMDRLGYTFPTYLQEDYMLFQLYLDINYSIINDTTPIDYPSVKYALGEKIGEHKGLIIYKSSIDYKKRKEFYEWGYELLKPMSVRIESNADWYGKVEKSAGWHKVPADWMVVRAAIWLYYEEINLFVLSKAKEHIPELITADGTTVDYSQLGEEGRQKLAQLAKGGVFDEPEMELIKMDVHHKMATYGTGL